MPQQNLPYGELNLGGKTRRFRLGYAAMANLASLGDESVRRAFHVVTLTNFGSGGIAIECAAYADLIWSGLKASTPGLTVDHVTAWLDRYMSDGGTLLDVYKAVNAAWDMPKVMPDKPKSEDGPADGAENPTTVTTEPTSH